MLGECAYSFRKMHRVKYTVLIIIYDQCHSGPTVKVCLIRVFVWCRIRYIQSRHNDFVTGGFSKAGIQSRYPKQVFINSVTEEMKTPLKCSERHGHTGELQFSTVPLRMATLTIALRGSHGLSCGPFHARSTGFHILSLKKAIVGSR